MERRKFLVNGRELESYQLSNEELVKLCDSPETSQEDKQFLLEKIKERFTYDLCKRGGETNDDVFARFFGNFVNGKCNSKRKVAELMCKEHRYLQNEMFKVCLEYIKALSENCEKGWFDPRNQYAAKTSKEIIDHFKEINYPY